MFEFGFEFEFDPALGWVATTFGSARSSRDLARLLELAILAQQRAP
jgi:hypothetical protein